MLLPDTGLEPLEKYEQDHVSSRPAERFTCLHDPTQASMRESVSSIHMLQTRKSCKGAIRDAFGRRITAMA